MRTSKEKQREYNLRWRLKNAEKWRKKNRLQIRKYAKQWRIKNIKKSRKFQREYYARNSKRINTNQRNYQKRMRLKVLSQYSKGNIKCFCCGEKEYEFLSLDHVKGNGSEHRRSLGLKTGRDTYMWCIKNNFPKGFRVLCHNCNFASGHYGICPHKKITSQ